MPRSRYAAKDAVNSKLFGVPDSPSTQGRRSSLVNSTEPRRRILLELFQAGLDRVSGRGSVARALTPASGPIWVAAIGKAASAMALGAHDVLGVSIERTLIITKDDHVAPQLLALRNVEIHESAHPVPDQRSLAAGASLLKWLQE